MGSSQQSTQQSQQTQPWSPAVPLLQNQLNSVAGLNSAPTAGQTTAANSLTSAVSGLPNFAPQATNIANSYLGGDPTGLLNPALSAYNSSVSPIANASLNPLQTPGFSNALTTMNNDITNQINGQFAGAGRSLSGLNAQTLARGLSQGDSSAIANQYNQNVANTQNAAGGLLGASGTTSSALTGNQMTGLNTAANIPTLAGQPANAQLSAANTSYSLPMQNLAQLESLTLPIAGLGSQSSGQSQSTYNPSLFSMLTQPLNGAGTGTGIGAGLGFLLSDRRMKKDIAQIGMLYDGTPVYRFRYLHDGVMHIGLMADEVAVEATIELGGIKYVDYEKATRRAMEASHGTV